MYKGLEAVYKGLKVVVYTVDKTEISLTHKDLVELINVRITFTSTHKSRSRNE